jgi:hypothetical protein
MRRSKAHPLHRVASWLRGKLEKVEENLRPCYCHENPYWDLWVVVKKTEDYTIRRCSECGQGSLELSREYERKVREKYGE